MANVTRWDPLEDSFDDLVKGFFLRPMRFEQQDPVRVKVDVKEDPTSYVVLAEIPGVKKEDIQVSIDGNQVAISAEVKRQQKDEKQGEKNLRSERYYGRVYRSFALAQDVDQEKAQAKYENGVLELRLPKKAAASTRTLTIQ
jgi:HSP20 family protein